MHAEIYAHLHAHTNQECRELPSPFCSIQVVVFDIAIPLLPGSKMVFHHLQTSQGAHIIKLVNTIDRATGAVLRKSPRCVPKNSSATIDVRLEGSVCLESYADCRELGRVLLRDQGCTVAAGIVLEILA